MTRRHRDVVIVGLSCAGKTTAAQYLKDSEYEHVEASLYMRRLFEERSPECSIGEFAARVLATDPYFVPRAVLSSRSAERRLVVTGFRSSAELQYFTREREARGGVDVIVIDAPQRLRFVRSLHRQRPGDPVTLEEFETVDEKQLQMGLFDLLRDRSLHRLDNSESLATLRRALFRTVQRELDEVLDENSRPTKSV